MQASPNSVPSQPHTYLGKIGIFMTNKARSSVVQKSTKTDFFFIFNGPIQCSVRPPTIKILALLMPLNYWSNKFSRKIIKICTNYELKICMSLAIINILPPSILDKGDLFTFIKITQYIHMYTLKFP